MIARDLQQIRATRGESSRARRNLLHVRVPLADLSTSSNLALIALTGGLRLVAGSHVDPEVAQLEVLLIHLEVRVVLKTPIHLGSAGNKMLLQRTDLLLPLPSLDMPGGYRSLSKLPKSLRRNRIKYIF